MDPEPTKATLGGKLKQCARVADAAQQPFGVCPCNAAAVQQKLTTACFVAVKDASGNVIGKCGGQRACTPAGLTSCAAPEAKAEIWLGLHPGGNVVLPAGDARLETWARRYQPRARHVTFGDGEGDVRLARYEPLDATQEIAAAVVSRYRAFREAGGRPIASGAARSSP